MCPACLTNVALMAAGAGSAGGMAAVVVKKLRSRSAAKNLIGKESAETSAKEGESR
jgi:hypothetical protein